MNYRDLIADLDGNNATMVEDEIRCVHQLGYRACTKCGCTGWVDVDNDGLCDGPSIPNQNASPACGHTFADHTV